jgi:hypothetical protein
MCKEMSDILIYNARPIDLRGSFSDVLNPRSEWHEINNAVFLPWNCLERPKQPVSRASASLLFFCWLIYLLRCCFENIAYDRNIKLRILRHDAMESQRPVAMFKQWNPLTWPLSPLGNR